MNSKQPRKSNWQRMTVKLNPSYLEKYWTQKYLAWQILCHQKVSHFWYLQNLDSQSFLFCSFWPHNEIKSATLWTRLLLQLGRKWRCLRSVRRDVKIKSSNLNLYHLSFLSYWSPIRMIVVCQWIQNCTSICLVQTKTWIFLFQQMPSRDFHLKAKNIFHNSNYTSHMI